MQPSPRRIGPYQLLRRLGSGGMGTVYEASHPRVPRPLALKVIDARGASERALDRFSREAELLARLRHPGVVAIHGLGRAPEGPYLVEDLVEGQTLEDLAACGMPPARAATIARALADALDAVHRAGILHRDLKPANVIVRPDGAPVLLDFGLARDVTAERLTRTGEVLGTPAYMAPEQARGAGAVELGPTADVDGLGAVLYHLLLGRAPFVAASLVTLVMRVIREEPSWPSEDAGGAAVPIELEAILRGAMAKAPAERYPTAAALRDDLDRFLRGEAPAALERLGLARSRRRRRTLLRAGAGLAGAAGLAAGGWGLLGLRPAASVAEPGAADSGAADTDAADPGGVEAPGGLDAAGGADAAAGGLWALPLGTQLRFRTHYDETDQQASMALGVWYEASAAPAPEGRARLDLRITRAVVAFGAAGQGATAFASRYDSQDPTPEHPLASVEAGVGQRFTLVLDPVTGAVSDLVGVDAIGERVQAAARAARVPPPPLFDRTVGDAFTDASIGRVFETLLHVRGAPPLPFEELPPRRGQPFEVRQREPTPPALRPLSRVNRIAPRHRFQLSGSARYADGRLLESRAVQELTGERADDDTLRPVTGLASRVAWSFELLDPP